MFSYSVQGHEFKDFDIWAKSGGANRAYIETVPVEVTNGEFRIVFTCQIENPEINAIEITPQTDPATDASAAPAKEDEPAPREPRRRGPAGFGRPVVLGPDDKPYCDDPPADYNVVRDNIPHGKLEMIQYDSKTVGATRNMNVYTPPGYSTERTVPRAVSSTRDRRRRNRVAASLQAGGRLGQPDRRRQGRAHDHRDAKRPGSEERSSRRECVCCGTCVREIRSRPA